MGVVATSADLMLPAASPQDRNSGLYCDPTMGAIAQTKESEKHLDPNRMHDSNKKTTSSTDALLANADVRFILLSS